MFGGPEKGRFVVARHSSLRCSLTAEAVQSAALALQSVDDVHGRHRLSLGVFGVRHGVADHVLEEHLQHAAGLLVDQSRDTLHTTTTGKTTDCRLCDALDVVAKNLAMTLGASLAESFASLSASRHACFTDEDVVALTDRIRMNQNRQRDAFYSARDADATDRTTLDSYDGPNNARTERFVDVASRTHTAVRSTRHHLQTVHNGRAKTSSFRSKSATVFHLALRQIPTNFYVTFVNIVSSLRTKFHYNSPTGLRRTGLSMRLTAAVF